MRKSTRNLSCFLVILISILQTHSLFASEVNSVSLADVEANAYSVLTGAVQSDVVKTSYGYVAVCEGRMITGFSKDGAVLWQKAATARPKAFISVGMGDLLCIVTGNSSVQLLSPTGLSLWKNDAKESVNEAPLFGWDGRIFARTKNAVFCWGLNGIQKWKLSLKDQDTNIPLVQLNDGSLLVFLTLKDGNNSVASHISPFGTLMNEVTFSGSVTQALSCDEGVLLVFNDGSLGLCSAIHDKKSDKVTLESRWRHAFPAGQKKLSLSTSQGQCVSVIAPSNTSSSFVTVLSCVDGSEITSYSATVNEKNIHYIQQTKQGLVLADSQQAVCYDAKGQKLWQAFLNTKKSWTKLFATDTGYLVLCGNDWTVSAYRMIQGVSTKESQFGQNTTKAYDSYYKALSLLSMRQSDTNLLAKKLAEGNYGEEEALWLSYLTQELKELQNAYSTAPSYSAEKPWFITHPSYAETVLNLASQTGCALFQKTLAQLIILVRDPQMLLCVIRAAKNLGFDTDGSMMLALETLLKDSSCISNVQLMKETCDAIVQICRAMGRPAYFRHGEDILKSLLMPSCDSRIRMYAVETLKTLAQLSI